MDPRQYKSRIHHIAARKAPTIAILQRKRSKLFHVIVIDTEALRITEGSWFHGKLYPMRCDVSFDGKSMVYLAMGASGKTWNGICRLPWLTTVIDAQNTGTWFGGGYFASGCLLRTNRWQLSETVSQLQMCPLGSRHISRAMVVKTLASFTSGSSAMGSCASAIIGGRNESSTPASIRSNALAMTAAGRPASTPS